MFYFAVKGLLCFSFILQFAVGYTGQFVVCVCACVYIIQPNDTKVFLCVYVCVHNPAQWYKSFFCTAINIPLSKSVHPALRKFLNEKVINGGTIPGFHQLEEMYFGAVFERGKKKGDEVTSCQKTCCCDIRLDSRCRGEMRLEHPPCTTWEGSFWDDLGLLCRYRFP